MSFRIEKDSMGEVKGPSWAYWGAQTQRAIENFPVSGIRIPPSMVSALGLIKMACAEENVSRGILPEKIGKAIVSASQEVYEGKWNDHFPVDIFQTGSGTSTNMNANEVIANRANEILGYPLGSREPVHPNDHVNRGQSSNDVFPSAVHIAVRWEVKDLLSSLSDLKSALKKKEEEFRDVVKLGRTHLQDAVPMTLGQEFSAYRTQIQKGIQRILSTLERVEELPLGGTAVGTGINAPSNFGDKVIQRIAERTEIPFRPSENRFEGISSRDAMVELMGALNTLAVGLMKIGNDLRLLASGPRGGLGEIELPALQPGSSIMPGKVNPVILEMLIQVSAYVMGSHLTVTIGGQNAPLELNIMQPLIAHQVLTSVRFLSRAVTLFQKQCVDGISANKERCREWIDLSLAMVTPLATRIGYDNAASLAYEAYKKGKKVKDLLLEKGILSQEEVEKVLDPWILADPTRREGG